ncbi:MAG: DUF4837 family protein [Bacteroidetes bacterium]|nr:DUF4837 family protein [Bacteroidota bacterium]
MKARSLSLMRGTLIASVLAISLFSACETLQYRPEAIGPEGEIMIVIDSLNWDGPLGDALREHLGPFVGTLPAPEPLFDLRRVSITSKAFLKTIKKQKNIVFASPLSDSTPEARFIRSRLDEAGLESIMNGRNAVIDRRDLWRRYQQVYYLMSATPEGIAQLLEENGEGLRYAFNEIARDRTTRDLFEKGRQHEIEERLLRNHGFAVNAQHDYMVAIDTTNFVWLRRIISRDSWRSLFVSYVDNASPNSLSPEWIYEARERLTQSWITGNTGGFVAIDFRRELTTENIDFLGRYGFETRGLWHMVGVDGNGDRIDYGMGGAFVNYAFYDEESERIYLIDGMIFAPGYSKREFLRHMEAIAHTFRTQDDEDRRARTEAQAGL